MPVHDRKLVCGSTNVTQADLAGKKPSTRKFLQSKPSNIMNNNKKKTIQYYVWYLKIGTMKWKPDTLLCIYRIADKTFKSVLLT